MDPLLNPEALRHALGAVLMALGVLVLGVVFVEALWHMVLLCQRHDPEYTAEQRHHSEFVRQYGWRGVVFGWLLEWMPHWMRFYETWEHSEHYSRLVQRERWIHRLLWRVALSKHTATVRRSRCSKP